MKGHGLERAGQGRCRQVPGGGPEFGACVVASEPSGLECEGLGVVVLLVSETKFQLCRNWVHFNLQTALYSLRTRWVCRAKRMS